MKSFLKILQHLCFVVGGILLLQFIFFSSVDVNILKGNLSYAIKVDDASTKFEDSDLFNEMLGLSLTDVINYSSLKNKYDNTPELHNSVSANAIGGGNVLDDLSLYGSMYDGGKGNVNFFVYDLNEDGSRLFSNVKHESHVKISKFKDDILTNSGKYLFYSSAEDKYETNTNINKATVLKVISGSEYSNAKEFAVLVAVNNDLSKIDDHFYEAKCRYDMFTDYFWIKVVAIVLCFFFYIILLVTLTVKEGVLFDKETGTRKICVSEADHIPTEIRIILFGLAFVPLAIIADGFYPIYEFITKAYFDNPYALLGVCAIALLFMSVIINFFYYGLVRRIKAHLIIKTSYTYKLYLWICNICSNIYKNLNVFLKSFIPCLIVFGVNALLFGFFASHNSVFALLVLFAADIYFAYMVYRCLKEQKDILTIIKKIASGDISAKVDENSMHGDNIELSKEVNNIGEAVNKAVQTSMKDEKMKADLITNVSHDLKTPLTSIINYVDLLKKEDINNPKAIEYIKVLEEKSNRLKVLTDDLVEASKISSGNMVLNLEKINVKELLLQCSGEFSDKFSEKNLTLNGSGPEDAVCINADGRAVFRIFENLYINIYKYALENTRVYFDIKKNNGKVLISIKNISANPLNISPEELTERFVRGEDSRTSEGSGLGLSIARSLTEAMGGEFEIVLDGDLFKVNLVFDEVV